MIPGKHRPGSPLAQQQIADLLGRGLALHQAGNLPQARETYRFALSLDPRQPDALHLLGVSFLTEHPGEAEQLIRQAIAASPRNPLYLANLGVALRNQHKFDDALAMFDKALRRKSDYWEAHFHRALTLLAMGRTEEALTALGRAIAHNPDHVGALKYRADILSDLDRFDAALADYDRVIKIMPGHAAALNNRGIVLLRLLRAEAALADFDAAIALEPRSPEIANSRGSALRAVGRLDDALAEFDRAAALKPDFVDAIVNRGSVLQDLARYDEALAAYAQAQRINPDHALAHWNDATLRLLTGDYARGFAEAEWQRKVPALGIVTPNFAQPLWLGESSLEGKTILVHADLGFGDTIHFARYIPMLAARGARVIARVQAALRKLIGTMEGVSLCIDKSAPLPEFDLHCPLSSLPLAFGTTLESIPAAVPYLTAPELPETWRERFGNDERMKIGLVWSGNATHSNDRNRSIRAELLAPLLARNAVFVGLQTEVRPHDRAALGERDNLILAGPSFADFSDTAAVVAALDLVITVDTSAAHLAGALGRPVWLLLPHVPDWRWLLDREDSPWYPTARLFRQDAGRDWSTVIARVDHALIEEFPTTS
ncbi:tetratricopeptide repeat protein [Bradyrhizobium sp. BR 10289]|uniref:tetratricopeptide repeat protein n=1 Tax=Bradyrhizobium sp. BR 10289 TaxID=2749993 RepID=UPI001C6482D3|nr:tetratricopeptide repeat protein [Bradyrhizobium sp. BR 10289]MBW7969477.1 tetratricopeptide repeat protein [Bradyrhizobium sp. BR 10289]